MQKIIIDGYNVIHADPTLRRLAAAALDRAREALVERLRRYVGDKAVQVSVVFDGSGKIVDAEPIVPGRLQVLYSAHGQAADDVIVDTLHAHPNPREFIVVTSDMADIGRAARSLGATVMASPEFLDRVGAGAGAGGCESGHGDEKPEPSDADVDYWLERFGTGRRGCGGTGEGKHGGEDD